MSDLIATIGAMVAVACAGLPPALGDLRVLAASVLAGLGLVALTALQAVSGEIIDHFR